MNDVKYFGLEIISLTPRTKPPKSSPCTRTRNRHSYVSLTRFSSANNIGDRPNAYITTGPSFHRIIMLLCFFLLIFFHFLMVEFALIYLHARDYDDDNGDQLKPCVRQQLCTSAFVSKRINGHQSITQSTFYGDRRTRSQRSLAQLKEKSVEKKLCHTQHHQRSFFSPQVSALKRSNEMKLHNFLLGDFGFNLLGSGAIGATREKPSRSTAKPLRIS